MQVGLQHKFSVKLILVISGILLANLALYTYFTTSHLKSDLILAYSQHAYNLSDVIKKSTRYSMLLNRSEDVHQIINTIGTEKDVVHIRIYNNTGTIMFSTNSTETKHAVDVNAEACVICHTKFGVFASVPIQDRIRTYTQDGKRLMGLINPIENEADCYNSNCHAHSAEQEILGVLDVVISVDNIEKIIRSNIANIAYNAIVVTFTISFFCGLFVTVMLNRPMVQINKGIQEIGKGNLDYKILLNSHDEFGRLAKRFNDMSAKLHAAYKEIKNWSDTLNTRVNQKTEELKKLYDQVMQIEKLASLGKLSATVAHELNNPLEGILTYSKLIAKQLVKVQKKNEYEKVLRYLSMISDESARCGRIVKDLLIFSHRDEEVFIREDVHDIIRKSMALIRHHLQIYNIEAVENYKASDSTIVCNPQKIQQALLAIFMNAIEAMNAGGKLIIDTATDGQEIHIHIKDTGLGVDPKDLPHIFEPFYTTKSGGKGTGLGLAVVFGIINHHNGSVVVESTSPDGTAFKITLPLPKKSGY
ncbi:HAMP domain-containing protein [bacterium]|nr:MAG: HAMP domain-containing protein [bacterium]